MWCKTRRKRIFIINQLKKAMENTEENEHLTDFEKHGLEQERSAAKEAAIFILFRSGQGICCFREGT
jgi:hypothetical protein